MITGYPDVKLKDPDIFGASVHVSDRNVFGVYTSPDIQIHYTSHTLFFFFFFFFFSIHAASAPTPHVMQTKTGRDRHKKRQQKICSVIDGAWERVCVHICWIHVRRCTGACICPKCV